MKRSHQVIVWERVTSVNDFMSVALQYRLHEVHGIGLRRFYTIQLILFPHSDQFMFAQLMIGQQFDFLDVGHVFGEFTQQVR